VLRGSPLRKSEPSGVSPPADGLRAVRSADVCTRNSFRHVQRDTSTITSREIPTLYHQQLTEHVWRRRRRRRKASFIYFCGIDPSHWVDRDDVTSINDSLGSSAIGRCKDCCCRNIGDNSCLRFYLSCKGWTLRDKCVIVCCVRLQLKLW
jgi:hypothetical protein